MRISTLLGGIALLFSSYAQAQTYCQPTTTVPTLGHAASQAFYSINVTSAGKTLLSYTDAQGAKAYNWLQETQSMKVTRGQALTVNVRSGIWTWDIQIGIDWDGDGTFDGIQRAFSTPGAPITVETSSWNPANATTFANADWRRSQQTTLGHRGVVYHTFTVIVPQDARIGKTRIRILCDGDGYNERGAGNPPFDMCGSVGYAGSMHDFGVEVSELAVVDNPIVTPAGGVYMSDQMVTLSSTTENVQIYYTLDGTEPSATNGTLYTVPFAVLGPEAATTDVVLKAIAVKEGMQASSVITETYTIQKSWSVGRGTIHTTEQRYVTSATTAGAKVNLDYSQTSNPQRVYINTGNAMTVVQGSSFNLTVQSTDAMKWEHAIIFVDWNKNYSFDDAGEQLMKIGNENASSTEVPNFTRTINVPIDAVIGSTRMRIQFTDAWHNKNVPNHTHTAEDAVDKGGVYDFIVNIEAPETTGIQGVAANQAGERVSEIYTINGVKVAGTVKELPKGIYIVDGKKVVVP